MKSLKFIFTLLVLIGLLFGAGLFGISKFKPANALLKVSANPAGEVFLNNKSLGTTPVMKEKLVEGEYDFRLQTKLKNGKTVIFTSKVTLDGANLTSVNYEFGPNKDFSSGDIRSLRAGSGLSVISSPVGSKVFLDGEEIGKTPLSLDTKAGIHKLKVSKDVFFTRELEINTEASSRLVVEVFLSANPFEKLEKIKEGRLNLYNLSTGSNLLLSSPESWSEGIFFYDNTRKLDFDALVSRNGEIYYKDKSDWEKKAKETTAVTVGYLGKIGEDQTSSALSTLAGLESGLEASTGTPNQTPTPRVEITATPTGFLNVRSGPGQEYNILTKVYPGQSYALLESTDDGWYKIDVSGTAGWISSQYARKI